MTTEVKAAISVSEMCRLLRMSRSQFYWHTQRGTFHPPLYLVRNKRPFFTASLVDDNVRARETGIGVNGQYVVFYERSRLDRSSPPPLTKKPIPTKDHSRLLASLRSLGLESATEAQVEAALQVCFPSGRADQDETEVLRTVYRHLKRAKGG